MSWLKLRSIASTQWCCMVILQSLEPCPDRSWGHQPVTVVLYGDTVKSGAKSWSKLRSKASTHWCCVGTLKSLWQCPGQSWGHQIRHNGAVWWHYKPWCHVLVEVEVSSLNKMVLCGDNTKPESMSWSKLRSLVSAKWCCVVTLQTWGHVLVEAGVTSLDILVL